MNREFRDIYQKYLKERKRQQADIPRMRRVQDPNEPHIGDITAFYYDRDPYPSELYEIIAIDYPPFGASTIAQLRLRGGSRSGLSPLIGRIYNGAWGFRDGYLT